MNIYERKSAPEKTLKKFMQPHLFAHTLVYGYLQYTVAIPVVWLFGKLFDFNETDELKIPRLYWDLVAGGRCRVGQNTNQETGTKYFFTTTPFIIPQYVLCSLCTSC